MITTTNDYLDNFAKEGLRTLLLAKKIIDPSYYAMWNERYKKASLVIQGREEAVSAVNDLIE